MCCVHVFPCLAQVFVIIIGVGQKEVIVNHFAPVLSYNKALQEAGKLAITSHCEYTCDNAFNSALKDEKNVT